MPPTTHRIQNLFFDKSAFQALSSDVHAHVRRQYNVVVAPTLLHEVAGDLREDRSFRTRTPEQHAAILAGKFGGAVTEHRDWRDISRGELLGETVSWREGPSVRKAIEGTLADGTRVSIWIPRADGSVISPTTNWIELVSREAWPSRYPADSRTLEAEVKELWGIMASRIRPTKVRPTDQSAAAAEVDRILESEALKEIVIRWSADNVNDARRSSRTLRQSIKRRWSALRKPRLSVFAPYTHYCARVQLLYLVGFTIWPKRRERNDFADLEYLRLLPFFDILVSDDRFVRGLAAHLNRPDQEVITSQEILTRLSKE